MFQMDLQSSSGGAARYLSLECTVAARGPGYVTGGPFIYLGKWMRESYRHELSSCRGMGGMDVTSYTQVCDGFWRVRHGTAENGRQARRLYA